MKAEELMIGNYVWNDRDGIMIISQICSDYVDCKKENDSQSVRYDTSSIKPIVIDENWILKLGYINIEDSYFSIKGHLIWICNDLFLCDKNGVILKSVHQLQNLYFALTNQKLILKN